VSLFIKDFHDSIILTVIIQIFRCDDTKFEYFSIGLGDLNPKSDSMAHFVLFSPNMTLTCRSESHFDIVLDKIN